MLEKGIEGKAINSSHTCIGPVVDSPGYGGGWSTLSMAGKGETLAFIQRHITR